MIVPHNPFGPLGVIPVADASLNVSEYYRPTFMDNAILPVLRSTPNTVCLFSKWVSLHSVISNKSCGGLGGLVLNEAVLHEMARLDGAQAPAYHSESHGVRVEMHAGVQPVHARALCLRCGVVLDVQVTR